MKSCLSTPKITEWLLACPTPSPAIPCPENPTTILKSDQKPKKKKEEDQETPTGSPPFPSLQVSRSQPILFCSSCSR